MALQIVIRGPGGSSFTISVDDGEHVIGRAASCDLRLPYPSVSGKHLKVSGTGSSWELVDLGSSNGTRVDGRRLSAAEPVVVKDGMSMRLGDVELGLHLVHQPRAALTLADSGTLLRQLVAEATDTMENAYLLSADGDRIEVPGHAVGRAVGENGSRFFLDRQGDGFRLRPRDEAFISGRLAAAEGVSLKDGDTIVTKGQQWTFVDPLEASVRTMRASEDQPGGPPPLSPLAWGFVALGGASALLASAALLVVFEIL